MDTRKRILSLMNQKQISYADLAKATGFSKSALQRYVTAETDKIPIDRVIAIAKALNVSPAYLMGWKEDEPQTVAVTEEEKQFLQLIRQLSPQGRAAAAQMLQSLKALQEQSSAGRE